MDSQTYNKQIIVFKEALSSLDCSPCDRYVVCSCWDLRIKKIDLVSQKLIVKSTQKHDNWINQIKYSPNAQFIASGSSDNTIIIWDASNLKQLGKTLLGHEDNVSSIAFSPDSLYLVSAGYDCTIRIWQCQSSEQDGATIGVGKYVDQVQYSPSGLQILSAGGGGINIWDFTTRKRIMTLTDLYTSTAQYSLDGKYIVSSSRGFQLIQIWAAATGIQIGNWRHSHSMNSVAFSPDSSLIVSGDDRAVRLWNFSTGEQVAILHKPAERVYTVLFSKNGKYVLSGSGDGTMVTIKIKQRNQ